MKIPPAVKPFTIYFISLLYILLFVYAAVSKLLDFENFRLQVSQSPMLTAFAGSVAVAVLVAELGISGLLCHPRTRRAGLLLGFTLMVFFSAYIFIILNYSPYIPCSCGGILEKMGWEEHMAFNVGFVVMGIVGVYLSKGVDENNRTVTANLCVVSFGAVGLMVLLLLFSENTLQHHNNFVRRFPPYTVNDLKQTDLKYSGYYFAGAQGDSVYLGNHYTPSVVVTLDTALNRVGYNRISLDDTLDLKAAQVRVEAPHFFVSDGNSACVYSGNVKDWKAKLKVKGLQRFTVAQPIDSDVVAFRATTTRYGNLLGTFLFGDKPSVSYKHGLLQKQVDGVFDTDGVLQYSNKSKKFVYVYFYRNQYIVTDKSLNLLYRSNTIDTTTIAKIKVAHLDKRNETRFSAPPQMVNRTSAVYRNLLFVNSMLPGQYESLLMWKKASIIDVYDLNDQSYVLSFYITHIDGKRPTGIAVTGKYLYALFDRKITVYRIEELIRKEYDKP